MSDTVTQPSSSTLIAGVGDAYLRAIERHSDDIVVPGGFRSAFIVVFVFVTAFA